MIFAMIESIVLPGRQCFFVFSDSLAAVYRMRTRNVIATYENFFKANGAARELMQYGFNQQHVKIAADSSSGTIRYKEGPDERGQVQAAHLPTGASAGARIGAGTGAALGTAIGLLEGLGMLSIPWLQTIQSSVEIINALEQLLVSAAAAAAAGWAAGCGLGMFFGLGIPDDEAERYADSLRKGSVQVIVQAEDYNLNLILDVLGRYRPGEISEENNF